MSGGDGDRRGTAPSPQELRARESAVRLLCCRARTRHPCPHHALRRRSLRSVTRFTNTLFFESRDPGASVTSTTAGCMFCRRTCSAVVALGVTDVYPAAERAIDIGDGEHHQRYQRYQQSNGQHHVGVHLGFGRTKDYGGHKSQGSPG
jgi:hypothetical protein